MREIINTFEQFCKKLDKNIIVEERILNDGKRILKCHGCTDCKSNCKSIERLKYYKFSKTTQKQSNAVDRRKKNEYYIM